MIELVRPFIGLGLLELQHLIYPRLLTGFWILVFFTNLSLVEFWVRYLALFCLLLVIDSFEGLWMESLQECLVKAKKFVFGVGKKNLHSGGCNFF